MTVHIIKLSVGTSSIEDLAEWQTERLAAQKRERIKAPRLFHTTGMKPKREQDVLAGGSIYWVIKGMILVRQRLIGFDTGHKDDGTPCCLLLLDPELVPVRPTPRRPFQGWRYLAADAAPPDLKADARNTLAEMPMAMRKELASLGLL